MSLFKNTTRRLRDLFKRKPVKRDATSQKDYENYKAAGCVFTDGKLILAGYQPKKDPPIISGIGGKRESDEYMEETAIRETIEELFETYTVPAGLVKKIEAECVPDRVIQNGSYSILVYDFKDLLKFLRICKSYKVVSPLYTKFPTTLEELLFERKTIEKIPEISLLALLPVVKHSPSHPFVDPYFVEDLHLLVKN